MANSNNGNNNKKKKKKRNIGTISAEFKVQ